MVYEKWHLLSISHGPKIPHPMGDMSETRKH